jgi:hypothetical protein
MRGSLSPSQRCATVAMYRLQKAMDIAKMLWFLLQQNRIRAPLAAGLLD